MAITKILFIRARLDDRVSYMTNKKKTTLDYMIEYAVKGDKAEQRLYEAAVNYTSPEAAYREMMATKERWGNRASAERVPFAFREDLYKLERISAETKLLCAHRIKTAKQLSAYRCSIEARINAVAGERKSLRNKARTAAMSLRPQGSGNSAYGSAFRTAPGSEASMSLQGVKVVVEITGEGAKSLVTYLYGILKDQKRMRGKIRLESLLRSSRSSRSSPEDLPSSARRPSDTVSSTAFSGTKKTGTARATLWSAAKTQAKSTILWNASRSPPWTPPPSKPKSKNPARKS